MTIKKFIGKTKEEALAKAKEEFGEGIVVMNVKEVKPTGFFSFLKSVTFEVTAAIEEKDRFNGTVPAYSVPVMQKKVQPQQMPMQQSPYAPLDIRVAEPVKNPEPVAGNRDEIEKKIENLSNILEKKLSNEENRENDTLDTTVQNTESFKFMKMLYQTLLDNEVNEKYVNQILDETEKMAYANSSVDTILFNVYQKMILKFGEPGGISTEGKKPKIVFFIGPTGVGKTTTIAKIASKYRVEEDRKIAFVTADTYRIAATEQLRIYANILDAPMSIVYSAEELNQAVEKFGDYDMIFVDTAGFSHRNTTHRMDTKKLIDGLDDQYNFEAFLVLSATTKYKDLLEIVDSYQEIVKYKLIFTKLDETTSYGNLLNIRLYSGADLSYMATGQNVPDDIEEFNSQKIVKQLLGGK